MDKYVQFFINPDGSTELVDDPIASGVCAWDGITKLRSTSGDIFSEYNRNRYDKAVNDLNDLKIELQNNSEFMSQFKNKIQFAEYFLFEAFTRLASPVTGEIYGTVATLMQALNMRNDIMMKALRELHAKEMIELYSNGAKNTNNDMSTPLLRIVNTDRSDFNQPTIKNLQLVD